MSTQRQLFQKYIAQTSDIPLMLEIEKAEGVYLFDTTGKKYLDLISGISVSNLGHNQPAVKAAILEQVGQYSYTMVYGEFVQGPQVQFAKALTDHLPGNLNNVYFVNSGSEAVEGAMKLAKRHTGRAEIAAFKNSYHGSTQGALSIIGSESFKQAFRPLLPGVRMLEFNNEQQLNEITNKTACVIVEPVQAEAGVITPADDFLQKIRRKCDETGALLIFDECQTGMGRTGMLFAFEHYGVVPDVITLAKALGGGMPLGAFISSKNIMSSLMNDPILGHITTFGGHPVSCAAGLAALKTIFKEELVQQVENKNQQFLQLLKHQKIKNIRSKGLLLAVEFENFEQNKKIIDQCLENGLLADWFLFATNCMRIAPPLVISNEEIEEACEKIMKSIDDAL